MKSDKQIRSEIKNMSNSELYKLITRTPKNVEGIRYRSLANVEDIKRRMRLGQPH